MLSCYIENISIVGPGINNWREFENIVTDPCMLNINKPPVLSTDILPKSMQRRSSTHVKTAIEAASQVFSGTNMNYADCSAIFASSENDGHTTDEICEAVTTGDRMVSPTRFHHSVNNASVGIWSITTGLKLATTSVICYENPFAAGIIEAVTAIPYQDNPLLLVVHDTQPPARLQALRPFIGSFATAMILSGQISSNSKSRMDIEFTDDLSESILNSEILNKLRVGNPAALCLPVLYAVAKKQLSNIVLPYIENLKIRVQITPC